MKKILIVENDAFLRQLYTDIFTAEKYEVTTSDDGKDAVEKIKKGLWDGIILDIHIPHLSGFEIMEELEKDKTFKKSCPILFTTNLEDKKEKESAEKYGDAYLVKGQFSPSEFLETVQSYLK